MQLEEDDKIPYLYNGDCFFLENGLVKQYLKINKLKPNLPFVFWMD
jgi:hypothetical protein